MKRLLVSALFSGAVLLSGCHDSNPPPPAPTYAIAGTVTRAWGGALQGVGVTVTLGGAAAGTATTDASGAYRVTGLANGSYTVTPVLAGYAFTPGTATVAVSGADRTQDFSADGAYTLSGTVTTAWDTALQGVSVALSGGGVTKPAATTDPSGRFEFRVPNGSFTLTPTLAGYAFTPGEPTVAMNGADRTQDFSADGAYAISGAVSGAVQGGVSIALAGGGVVKPAAVSADATGAYTFDGIPDGTYTLTPSLAGYAFSPDQATVVVSGASKTQDFTSTAVRRIAGTVKDMGGAPLAGMTVRLAGASKALATTDATGAYAFEGLAAGASYTVESATFAFLSSPPERAYTLAADVTDADFTAALYGMEPLAYAGTVSYAGAKSGPVYVTVSGPYGGGNPAGGTGLAAQQGPWADRAFGVRNAQAGTSVTVRAWMDTLGTGRFNAGADPSAYFSGSLAPGQPLQIPALELTDPAPPEVASPLAVNGIVPGDGIAVVVFDVPRNAQWEPVADTILVSWNDAATVDDTHRLGSFTVPAGSDFGIVRGLTNGTPYWFRVDAYLDGVPLAGQTAVTPDGIAPAPAAGTASVTGKVTHPAVAAPSALYVVAQAGKGPGGAGSGGIFFDRIGSPAGTETQYALDLPPGTYLVFAFIDLGDDGAVGVGEPAAFPGSSNLPFSTFVDGANAGPTVALPAGNAAVSLRTSRWMSSTSTWTYLVLDVAAGARLPLSAVVTGPGLRGAVDLGMSTDGGSGFDLGAAFQTEPALPYAGDTYEFAVAYTDGTVETFHRDVTAVFGSPPLPLAPAPEETGVATVPTFSWSPPAGAPGPYGYVLQVRPENGEGIWETFLSGGVTSVQFNADGTAGVSALAPYTRYAWMIRAIDGNGNDASYEARFTTGAATLPLLDALDGTTLDGLLWQTPQYVRAVSGGEAVFGVQADGMQAFTVQGAQYMNAIPVRAGASRVTTLRATVTVPTGALERAGTGVAATGIRLLYQPAAYRGLPFPRAIMNTLTASLELYDAGSGLHVRRRFLHCDVASCATFSATGIATVDPAGFTASADDVDAWAPAQYDVPYTFELTADEASGLITWSIDGLGAARVTGTGNASAWLAGKMTLATGFTFGQIFSRAIDLVGGSSAGIVSGFDDVYVGLDGGAPELWDDFQTFSATAFDPRRWGPVDSDVFLDAGLHVASALTTAVDGALGESTGVNLMYPTSLRAWQVDVAFAVDEPAAAAGSSTAFSMVGAFFNDGSGAGPDDATGDVRASVRLSGAGSGYDITRCGTATCSGTRLTGGPLFPTRPMTPGTVHTLLVLWNPGVGQLTFAIDEAMPVVVDVSPYTPVGSPTPNYPLHQLLTNVSIAPGATAGASSRLEAVVTNVRGIRN